MLVNPQRSDLPFYMTRPLSHLPPHYQFPRLLFSHGSSFCGDRVREPTAAASLLYLQASERPSQGNPGPLLSCSPHPLVFSATMLGETPQLCIPKGPQKFPTDSESDHPAQGQLITERGTPSCPPDPEKKPTSSVFPPSFIRTTEESPSARSSCISSGKDQHLPCTLSPNVTQAQVTHQLEQPNVSCGSQPRCTPAASPQGRASVTTTGYSRGPSEGPRM